MEKTRQQNLIRWLKAQSIFSRRWLNIFRLLSFISGLLVIAKGWLLACIFHHMIRDTSLCDSLLVLFIVLVLVFVFRVWVVWLREKMGFYIGQNICREIRRQVLDRLQQAGPAWIQGKPTGSWTTLILEQIDNMHDYYAHYLPHTILALYVPSMITFALFLINWTIALILVCTVPIILLFIMIVSISATDANRRNFLALTRLSGHFLDRLRGIETLRLFNYGNVEIKNIFRASQELRQLTMKVLRLSFLSSGILEFFTSLSIFFITVYFSLFYVENIGFSHYGSKDPLLAGFFALILVPEFFQPLRDLGTFYHAKAQAIGAADSLNVFMETSQKRPEWGNIVLHESDSVCIMARDLSVLSLEGKVLVGPLNFTLLSGQRGALVGVSGSGKSSLLNVFFGFLPYSGSLRINHTELRELNPDDWYKVLSWVGQDPQLPASTLRDNVMLARPSAQEKELNSALKRARVSEFLSCLPKGIDTIISNQGMNLSVGQAQRVALARALLNPCKLLLLDEPTANLDIHSAQCVMNALDDASREQTTLMVTHQLNDIAEWDQIWVMQNGKIIEQGDYSTLCALHGAFFSLLTSGGCQEEI